jgi:Acetyltransferase (GNAT) domain
LKHDLAIGGHGFRLRPLELADAGFVVEARRAAGPFINRGAMDEAAQREWIERYFLRDDDYGFVVERLRDARREGVVGIYAIDRARASAEWGRFVLRSGSIAAVEVAWLVYRCGFERLGLDVVRCRTLVGNASVVEFHDSCGLTRADATVSVDHDGRPAQAIEHILARPRWAAVGPRLDRLAARVAAAPHAEAVR